MIPSLKTVLLTLFLLSAPDVAMASEAEVGDDLTVSVLTFGPHEHPFFKFGHNAILVRREGKPGWVFNFGTFQFDSIDLLPKFLKGRVIYWLSVSSEQETLESYAAANRTIVEQELALAPAAKLALWEALKENAKPENRGYLYDYFRDNCSTRVRDAIDRATGGLVKSVGTNAPGTATYRSHALRMTADFLPEYVGLYLALGRLSDKPTTRWDEAFLPEKFQQLIRDVKLPGPNGRIDLVRKETTVFAARRDPPPATAPSYWPYFLLVGLALGGIFASVGFVGRRNRFPRAVFGGLLAVFGLVIGLLGLLLVLFWLFTDHVATHANANILQLPAIALAFSYYGVRVAIGTPRATRRAFKLALFCAALSFLGVVVKTIPGRGQDNFPIIAAAFPVWLGIAFGLKSRVAGLPIDQEKHPRK